MSLPGLRVRSAAFRWISGRTLWGKLKIGALPASTSDRLPAGGRQRRAALRETGSLRLGVT